jgi:FKBP-type peptidyl-prolyl cis-trans isomerase
LTDSQISNMRGHFLPVLALTLSAVVEGQELKIDVTKKVDCDVSKKTMSGHLIHVNYNGTLTNGTLFDSSTRL